MPWPSTSTGMLGHFLKRDFQDSLLWWLGVGIVTLLVGAGAWVVPGRWDPGWWLWAAYYLFAFFGAPQVLGSVWRTPHQWSRHYLLALPIPHWRLFAIQHVRMLVFWLPVSLLSGVAPTVGDSEWRPFTPVDWGLYYLGLLTSVGLLMEMGVWMTLDQERIATYVPKRQRLWAWARIFGVMYGLMGLLGLAWYDLLIARPLRGGRRDSFAALALVVLSHWPGASIVLFPAGLLLGILWARYNARRWCVTL